MHRASRPFIQVTKLKISRRMAIRLVRRGETSQISQLEMFFLREIIFESRTYRMVPPFYPHGFLILNIIDLIFQRM